MATHTDIVPIAMVAHVSLVGHAAAVEVQVLAEVKLLSSHTRLQAFWNNMQLIVRSASLCSSAVVAAALIICSKSRGLFARRGLIKKQ